jgi:predicted DNA-binding WGR domain protein
MTSRRFPPPWHADKIRGGYVVRDASGQALAYLYSRDNDAEARQAKAIRRTKRGGSPPTSRSCRSCLGRASSTDVTPSDRPGRFCALLSIRHSNGPIFLGFCRYYYFGIRGAKMGRENPEFWRLQAEDAKKASKPEMARQYERIAKIIEERLNDLEKRAPAASDLRKLSMRKKQPGLKSA